MRDLEGSADFRKQPVWRQAFHLTIDVYRLMGVFPALERWDGLATMMRKSVSNMGAHIAEGCTQPIGVEGALFFQMAQGCSAELLHHLLVAKELGYIDQAQLDNLEAQIATVRRLLSVSLQDIGAYGVAAPEVAYDLQ